MTFYMYWRHLQCLKYNAQLNNIVIIEMIRRFRCHLQCLKSDGNHIRLVLRTMFCRYRWYPQCLQQDEKLNNLIMFTIFSRYWWYLQCLKHDITKNNRIVMCDANKYDCNICNIMVQIMVAQVPQTWWTANQINIAAMFRRCSQHLQYLECDGITTSYRQHKFKTFDYVQRSAAIDGSSSVSNTMDNTITLLYLQCSAGIDSSSGDSNTMGNTEA